MLGHFDLTLVINLEHREDRRQSVRAQLRGIGHDFSDRVRLFKAVKPDGRGAFPSVGARGCFLSHMGCLAEALREGVQSLLILEDDVLFTPDARGFAVPADGWDAFYGGYRLDDGLVGARDAGPGLLSVPPMLELETTHCVGLRMEAIRALHDYLEAMLGRPEGSAQGGPMHVDGAYCWFRREIEARTLIADPQIALQTPSASDVTPCWRERIPGVGLLRRLKGRARGRG